MLNGKKIIQGLLALVLLIGSAILAFGMAGYDLRSNHALAYGITTTDFYIPSSLDPWGTTFDSKGTVGWRSQAMIPLLPVALIRLPGRLPNLTLPRQVGSKLTSCLLALRNHSSWHSMHKEECGSLCR